MDTTKKYIEMCEKAREIQKIWKPKEGDFHCYIDVMCGHPVYTVKYSHLNDVHKTDAMKGHQCPLCKYDYDTFQEILAIGRKHYDRLTGWFVWLPRQDQLQEMIRHQYMDNIKSIWPRKKYPQVDYVWHWLKNVATDFHLFTTDFAGIDMFGTMEQLWLAFVMKEKFNKVWDNKKNQWERKE